MCGIAGIIAKEKSKEKVIRKMTEAIHHRGPDEDGFHIDERVALGMRRLSIIDLAHGTQPIYSSDKRYLIIFNGEIYNYKELKERLVKKGHEFETGSDTEVVLRMYEVYGVKMLSDLRGMFTFAILDTSTGELCIARDFFGIKPLYYLPTDDNRLLAFASEVKSILEIPGLEPVVNDEAVYNYLRYQYNPLPETFFKGIYKLMPGHYMLANTKTGVFEIERYWQFSFKEKEADEAEMKKKILMTMKDSVAHHMIADVPVGAFLSGGIDSSIIATLMQMIRGTNKIKTFTVGFDSLTEAKEAKETSEPLGTDHREISVGPKEYFAALPKAVWHFDEPVADPSAIGLYFLAKEARKHVKVVLSGEGSDELFGGYNIYLEPFARQKIAWLPKFVLKVLASMPLRGKNYAERATKKIEEWYIGNASIFRESEVKNIWKGGAQEFYSLDYLYKEVGKVSDSTKMQYIDIHTWLIGDILSKADKMTMAHSLELRVPFLDVEVAKLAATLPDNFKWRRGETKSLLRDAFKNILPESTRKRKKLGFPTPIRTWLTKDREDINKLITENEYIKTHLDLKQVALIWDDHVSSKKDNSRKIYLLLMLALWYNQFISD